MMKRSIKRNALAAALALGGMLSLIGIAQADSMGYIQAEMVGNPDGRSQSNGGGHFTFDRNPTGLTDFGGTLVSGGAPEDGTFYAFCLEPSETVGGGSLTYDVRDLSDAPVNNNGNTPNPMGSRAGDMRELLGNVFPDFSDTSQTSTFYAAVQYAIWEIANEESGSYDIFSGDHVAGSSGSVTSKNMAQGWLAQLGTDVNGWVSTKKANGLVSLIRSDSNGNRIGGQDFVAQVVPIPAAVWLFGSALAGLAVLGRRRRKEEDLVTA